MNPNDTNNIAYYLNSTFKGNLGSIAGYIKNHNWNIGNEKNESSRKTMANIALISYSEARRYLKTYGGFLVNTNNTWTRTPSSIYSDAVWMIDHNTSGFLNSGVVGLASKSLSARPTLYVEPGLIKIGSGTIQDPYILLTEIKEELSEIKDLSLLKTSISEITLTWLNPTESNFSHLNIYQNGILVKTDFTESIYTFKGLNASQEYTFTVKAVDEDGKETEGISIVVSTDDVPLVPEIQNLKATTKHDRVNLSWKNPQSEFFNHVKIYRRVDEKETAAIKKTYSFFQPLKVEAAEADDYNPMFETNGTYWNDLTVEVATTYSYKLTTVNIAEAESEGTTIQVTTEGEPLPEIGGGGYEEQENGDFLYTWTSPETGQVRVMIDGKEYRTVDAATKQILIPKADMKYDIFKRPKVTLVPISENGKEGVPSKPPNENGGGGTDIGGAELPFTVKDMVTTGLTLLGLVAGFVLLGLAFRFVPKFIATIFTSFRSGAVDEASRNTEREPRHRRSV